MTSSRENEIENFKLWMRKSKEAEKQNPERYLNNYDLEMDDTNVWMTQKTYDLLVRHCGIHRATEIPPGQHLGKLFVRNQRLMWFGIAEGDTAETAVFNSRLILIRPVNAQGPAHPPTY